MTSPMGHYLKHSTSVFEIEEEWSASALMFWRDRYLAPGQETDSGQEPLRRWLLRACKSLCIHYSEAERDTQTHRYFGLLYRRRFLPTTATLVNAALGEKALSGCIVIPLPSDIKAVLTETLPRIFQSLLQGAGVGLDLSSIPPRLMTSSRLAPIENKAKEDAVSTVSPGPIELLAALANAADVPIAYVGVKRPAFMGSLSIAHPDLFEFIAMKRHRKLPSVNLSISLDHPFITALNRDGLYELEWSDDSDPKSSPALRTLLRSDLACMAEIASARGLPSPDLFVDDSGYIHSRAWNGRVVGRAIGQRMLVEARTVWRFIAEAIHDCGEPGILNLDAIQRANPTNPNQLNKAGEEATNHAGIGYMQTTAPCGEQPLLPNEVCQLGSLNLTSFLLDGGKLDEQALAESTKLAVCLLDDVIETSDLFVYGPDCAAVSLANRKIGVGVMGLADILAEWEMPYDSEIARDTAANILRIIYTAAQSASEHLAEERGRFPSSHLLKESSSSCRRHATLTSLPPTGNISILADCFPSIEPYFSFAGGAQSGSTWKIRRFPVLDRKLKELGITLDQWIKATQEANPNYRFDGTLSGLQTDFLPDGQNRQRLQVLKAVFRTAREITPMDHLRMVAALQPYIDNGISKTINLPDGVEPSTIEDILNNALEMGLKGVTLFPSHPTPASGSSPISLHPQGDLGERSHMQ